MKRGTENKSSSVFLFWLLYGTLGVLFLSILKSEIASKPNKGGTVDLLVLLSFKLSFPFADELNMEREN